MGFLSSRSWWEGCRLFHVGAKGLEYYLAHKVLAWDELKVPRAVIIQLERYPSDEPWVDVRSSDVHSNSRSSQAALSLDIGS